MLGVGLRIADEIGKAALERIGPDRHDRIAAESDLGIKARPFGIETQVLQKFRDVDFRRAFAGVAPRKGEIDFQHALHFHRRLFADRAFRRSRCIRASESLNRVRMVRRSWLTPFSMVVRCSKARSMRRFISMKA